MASERVFSVAGHIDISKQEQARRQECRESCPPQILDAILAFGIKDLASVFLTDTL